MTFDHVRSDLPIENIEDLYENAPSGHLSFLADGTIHNVNQTLLTWLGYSREELVGVKRFQDIIPVGEQIFFETHFSPLLRMQGDAEEINFHLVVRDNKRIPVLTTTKKKIFPDSDVEVYRMSIFKISDRKLYESELIRERTKAQGALRAKTAFLSMLSHEIRTPLNAIIGITNLLDTTELNDEQKIHVDRLQRSSSNLMELLNSILDLSKIESGKATLEKREFRVRMFANDIIRVWEARAKEKAIKLNLTISDDIPEILIGDHIKIGQIITNLVGNAIKFTEFGSVSLSLTAVEITRSEVYLCLEVSDTGIGVSSENIEHIFDEYQQADYEIAGTYGGSGLGLAISRRIAEMHGSNIKVESTPGMGSKFSVLLKLGIGTVSQNKSTRSALPADALQGLSVLVADDSSVNRELIGAFFKKWGVKLTTAKDGNEALEIFRREQFDIVLMDLRMPGLNGYDATVAMRSELDESKKHIPIIAFSASTRFGDFDLAETMAFDDIIGKPFKPDDLFAKLLLHSKRVLS